MAEAAQDPSPPPLKLQLVARLQELRQGRNEAVNTLLSLREQVKVAEENIYTKQGSISELERTIMLLP